MDERAPQPQRTARAAPRAFPPEALRQDVETLAGDIGERNLRDGARLRRLRVARDFLQQRLEAAGCPVRLLRYEADGHPVDNLEVEVPGAGLPGDVVVVGAHYDSARGSPGARDNATGVAALLALATAFQHRGEWWPRPTLRFVAFATGGPPFAHSAQRGSRVYARRCRERGERVRAMLSLEGLGGVRGGPLRVVGNLASWPLVRRCVQAFPPTARVRCRGLTLPGWVPGVGASDASSFWEQGWPAAAVTDSALLRPRHAPRPTDVPARVDAAALAQGVGGLFRVVLALVGEEEPGGG